MFLIALLMFQLQEDTIFNLRTFRVPEAGATRTYFHGYLSLPWINSEGGDDSLRETREYFEAYYYLDLPWQLELLGEHRFVSLEIAPYTSGSYGTYRREYEGIVDSSIYQVFPDIGAGLYTHSFSGLYLGKSPFFAGISDTLNSGFWFGSYKDNENSYSATVKGVYGSLFIGPGIGRIRNVTTVIHAWQFLDEIGKSSHDNVEALAGLLARKYLYSIKYSRYEKYFYEDVEKLLVENGIVTELSTFDLMRLREIIATMQPGRLSGLRVWLGTGGNGEIMQRLGTDTSYTRSNLDKGVLLNLEAAYPLSRRWQLSFASSADLLTPDWSRFENHARGKGSITYYLTDRLELSLGVVGRIWDESQATEKWVRPEDPPGWHIDYIILPVKGCWLKIPLDAAFYLEDKLYIYASSGYGWSHHEYQHYDGSIYDYSGFFIETGLTWRLR